MFSAFLNSNSLKPKKNMYFCEILTFVKKSNEGDLEAPYDKIQWFL